MSSSPSPRSALLRVDHVVPHTDADGLAAGALALRARGETAEAAVLLSRGETPFGKRPPLRDGTVAVLDWGIRELDRSGILIDHHAPEAEPRHDQLAISGYGERQEPTAAVLVHRLLPGSPSWLAAVGACGDLGDRAFDLPDVATVRRAPIRRLVPLVNAPRRLLDGPVREALGLLIDAVSPEAALGDPRIELLDAARRAWRAEFDRVRRTAPVVEARVALIRFSSPAQVHPLVAAQWQRRLAPRVVLAANDGYLPGRVNFSVRADSGDLRRLLREALPEADGEFAHGHDRATGGSLDTRDFELLLERLGFRRGAARRN